MSKRLLLAIICIISIVVILSYLRTSDNTSYCGANGVLSTKKPHDTKPHFCLSPSTANPVYSANVPTKFSFSLIDSAGTTIKDFGLTHTKPLHFIIVRKDLQYFQHLHPEYDIATGMFTLNDLTFPVTGEYRAYADFAPKLSTDLPDQNQTALATYDFKVGSSYVPEPLGSLEQTKTFDGNRITLAAQKPLTSGNETTLGFVWQRNGKPVTDLQEYLGALGHSVIIREGTLEYLHTHPVEAPTDLQTGTVHFMVAFPQGGNYKIFTQFERGNKIITTDFVVAVTQSTTSPASAMPEMRHMHEH